MLWPCTDCGQEVNLDEIDPDTGTCLACRGAGETNFRRTGIGERVHRHRESAHHTRHQTDEREVAS
jgi:hypothetical protein